MFDLMVLGPCCHEWTKAGSICLQAPQQASNGSPPLMPEQGLNPFAAAAAQYPPELQPLHALQPLSSVQQAELVKAQFLRLQNSNTALQPSDVNVCPSDAPLWPLSSLPAPCSLEHMSSDAITEIEPAAAVHSPGCQCTDTTPTPELVGTHCSSGQHKCTGPTWYHVVMQLKTVFEAVQLVLCRHSRRRRQLATGSRCRHGKL